MTVAADKLGMHQFTLVNQINRIESELGMKLLIRAERECPNGTHGGRRKGGDNGADKQHQRG